jgi:hypothetical protein
MTPIGGSGTCDMVEIFLPVRVHPDNFLPAVDFYQC